MRSYSIKKSIILILIIINISFINIKVSFGEEIKKNHILILNSYHKGYTWTDSTVKGIESILKNGNNVIHIEYMDAKIIKDQKHLSNLYELYKHKFNNYKFDVIIASDNDAYNFLKEYHKDLFNDTPIICSGLNAFDDFIINKENGFTGVAETIDVKDTLDICFKLHKNVKNVVVTADYSLAGDMTIDIIKKIVPLYNGNIKFYFFQNDSIDKLKEYLREIPKNSMILQTGLYKDKFREPITIEQGNKIILEVANVPIYSCWEMNLGNGIIGGKMISGYKQGQTVGEMALQVLNGKNVKDIPFIKNSSNKYIFDYNSMNKYNIKTADLPLDSIIRNKPSSFIRMSKKLVYFHIALVIIILIIINFILFRNILKLKSVKRQVIKEKTILKAILDSTGDGILFVDKDKSIIQYNNRFCDMWRLPKEILDTKNDEKIMNYVKDQLIDPNEFVNRIKEKSKRMHNEIDVINFKDGRMFQCFFQPLMIEGETNGRVWNFRDITEKIELEHLEREIEIKEKLLIEAKKYEKIKDQFFTTISHELKTPLNIILGVVQLIDKTFCEQKFCIHHEKLNKYMNMSKQNCYRLLKLINNLIDITKIDSGFMNIEFKNYNIVSVIENITLSIAEYIESKGIQLIFDTEIEEKIMACDAEKLERVMLNLLSNAVKFTEEGGAIMVNIYDKGESILISVKDTGIGIPIDMKEKIFDRFIQVDSSLRRRAEGSGIGLSLVKAIVEMHNGVIDLESNVGEGSKFTIQLPVSLVDEKCDVQEELTIKVQSNVERISIEFSDIYS